MNLTFTEKDCLEAAVVEIIGEEELRKALKEGVKLRVKLGIDPTSPNIHLGRSIPLWRLRAFQELGHEIHLIIGDFTGQIGDTSDKESERPMLAREKIEENMRRYMEQFWMILNPELKDRVIIHYNSEWLNDLTLGKITWMADAFSVNSFIKRELIARRLEEGSRVSLREMLYPLMQGYDSVVLKANVELGGTDQRFNLLAGRTLQEQAGQPPQAIIMNHLISGTDGRKMSSSWGNVIALLDTPRDKFGKVMSIRDDILEEYLQILPYSVRPYNIQELRERLEKGENPRNLKLELAWTLVALYHGEAAADKEKQNFISQFSEHKLPGEIEGYQVESEEVAIIDLLVKSGLAPSRSEARRLVEQKGVKVENKVIEDPNQKIIVRGGEVVQVGKRRFVRLVR